MNKRVDLAKYYLASERLRKHGIGMLATFVAGFDGDTYEDVVNISEFGDRFGLFTIQVYARGITPGSTDDLLSAPRNLPDRLDRYFNGHGVCILPGSMLPSDLQRGIFEAAFRFHRLGNGARKLALRAFQSIWVGMRPHYEALQRIEREILVPEGIYRERVTGGYTLQSRALDALYMDDGRYGQFRSRCATIFRESEPAGVRIPVPVPRANVASSA
jgi:hypothetical protein